MFCQCEEIRPNDKMLVLVDSIKVERNTQEDVGMRGQCRRCIGKGVKKNDSLLCEHVYVGRFDVRRVITAHAVRPQRIHRDQKNIGSLTGCTVRKN